MTKALPQPAEKPLNNRQLAFARELGIAMARGDRDFTAAYAAAGYAADRGNAARLAADPRIKAIVDKACEEAARLNGLHIGYLQGKALELLHATPTAILRKIAKFMKSETIGEGDNMIVRFVLRDDLTDAETAELDAAAWPLSKLKIDTNGVIALDLPDKKAIIEMLAKQLGVGKDNGGDVNVSVTLESLVAQSMQSRPDEPMETRSRPAASTSRRVTV